jgi:hypothetical protein
LFVCLFVCVCVCVCVCQQGRQGEHPARRKKEKTHHDREFTKQMLDNLRHSRVAAEQTVKAQKVCECDSAENMG